jgi:hypothetical protein
MSYPSRGLIGTLEIDGKAIRRREIVEAAG